MTFNKKLGITLVVVGGIIVLNLIISAIALYFANKVAVQQLQDTVTTVSGAVTTINIVAVAAKFASGFMAGRYLINLWRSKKETNAEE